jgi:folate-dependent phosphoribosylglycinamide formyltransferase PurN
MSSREGSVRVVMFGYQTWGHRTLQALLGSEYEVTLVVTHPPSDHAYERIWNDSVADLAAAHGVPVEVRDRPDDSLLDALKTADPDVIVATNWRTWIPPQIFDLPRLGTLNVHDSLLPAYAGFSPLIWALINGEERVGVTAHMMDGELDAGDVVLQRSVPATRRPICSTRLSSSSGRSRSMAWRSSRPGKPTGRRRIGRRRASSTSGPKRTAGSTGPGRPKNSTGWSAHSPTPIRTLSRSTTGLACASCVRRSLRARTAERPAASSSVRVTPS